MRIPSGKADQNIYFVAVDATDLKTRKTGLATWTVYRSRNGAAEVLYTTPTITEIDATNMPGVYALLVDEDTTIAAGSDSEEYCVHITHAGMAPVTRTIELYRRDTTSGSTLSITEGDFSDILSRLTVTNSQLLIVKSDTSDIRSALVITNSDTAHIESQTTRIHSDTITLASDLAEADFSDIISNQTIIKSQLLIVKSDTSDIKSHLTVLATNISDINSDTNALFTMVSDIQSDTNKLVSDATEVDTSDLHSLLTLVRSDTAVIESVTSDIQSDTNVLITKMRGVVLATGTIGATGNTTTVIHIPDTVLDSLSDDEIKYYNVVIYDVSNDEYHVRNITAWTDVGDLATVAPALPFTPEASVDLYWIMPPWANQFDYDASDLYSLLTLVRSDTTVIETVTSDIQSDTNKLVSDATEVDTSDLHSLLTLVRSDTTHIESQTTRIHSDTITLASDLAEADFSDIQSNLTIVKSQLLIVKSDTSDIRSALVIVSSDTAHIESQTTRIHSDTITLASDLAEADFSDIQSHLAKVYSDTTILTSHILIVKSDTSDIISALVKVYSDTTAIEGVAGGGLSAAQDSRLTETNSQVVRIFSDMSEVDTSDIQSLLTKVYSDTALATTAVGEPAQGAPPASATPQNKIDYLYKAWRNKTESTATQYSLYDDAGTTVDHKATLSDDSVTFTRTEVASGP